MLARSSFIMSCLSRFIGLVAAVSYAGIVHAHTYSEFSGLFAPFMASQEAVLDHYQALTSKLPEAQRRKLDERPMQLHFYSPPTLSYCTAPFELAGLRRPPNKSFPPTLVLCKRAVIRAASAVSTYLLFLMLSDDTPHSGKLSTAMAYQASSAVKDHVWISTRNIDAPYPCSPIYCAYLFINPIDKYAIRSVPPDEIEKFAGPRINRAMKAWGLQTTGVNQSNTIWQFERFLVSEVTKNLLDLLILHEISHWLEDDLNASLLSLDAEVRADKFAIDSLAVSSDLLRPFLHLINSALLVYLSDVAKEWSGQNLDLSARADEHLRHSICGAKAASRNKETPELIRNLLIRKLQLDGAYASKLPC